MTKYINIKTKQYPVPAHIVERYARKADRPNFVDTQIGKLEPVTEVPKPHVVFPQVAKEGKPELKDGAWTQTWIIEQLPDSEAREIFDKAAKSARTKRDSMLKESDWTQLQDSPVDKDKWAKYRSELRSLPQQTSFPFSIVWPVKP